MLILKTMPLDPARRKGAIPDQNDQAEFEVEWGDLQYE
jgi:hypothetical protein